MPDRSVIKFSGYALDGATRSLTKEGEGVSVEPKALDLLLYLAENRDRAVGKDELQDAVWPGAIVTETALTRCVMKARRAVGDDRETQQVIRTVHGHGYQFVAALTENEPEIIEPEPSENASPVPKPSRQSKPIRVRAWFTSALLGAAAVLAIVALVRLFSDRVEQSATIDNRSLAVLPFSNRSDDTDDARFLADGIHDDLLTLLSKLGDLRVISRTSVQQFREPGAASMADIAERLGVGHIVEGGVQRAGDRVRINVQLFDASRDENLWAESYDRQLSAENLFEIQGDIARAIADQLHATLSPTEQRVLNTTPTRNLDALYAYQRGRQAFDRTTASSLETAKSFYTEALEQDPDFAEAQVGLAYTYLYLPTFGSMSTAEGYSTAAQLIAKAISTNPTLGEAYAARAILESREGKQEESLASFRQALSLTPNSTLNLITYALALNRIGRAEEALPIGEKAMKLDPLLPLPYLVFGDSLEALGRYEEALDQYRRTAEISPDSQRGFASVGDLMIELGQVVEGTRWTREAMVRAPKDSWLFTRLGRLAMDFEDLDAAAELIDMALQLNPEGGLSLQSAAYLNLLMGDRGGARQYAGALTGRLEDEGLRVQNILDMQEEADPQVALRRYEEAAPELFQTPPPVTAGNYRTAVDLANYLLQTGNEEQANLLLDAAWSITRSMGLFGQYGKGVLDAEILNLQGKPQQAVTAFEDAVRAGWRYRWWLYGSLNPNLASLRGTPAFERLLEEIRRDLGQKYSEIKLLDQHGDMPPIPTVASE